MKISTRFVANITFTLGMGVITYISIMMDSALYAVLWIMLMVAQYSYFTGKIIAGREFLIRVDMNIRATKRLLERKANGDIKEINSQELEKEIQMDKYFK